MAIGFVRAIEDVDAQFGGSQAQVTVVSGLLARLVRAIADPDKGYAGRPTSVARDGKKFGIAIGAGTLGWVHNYTGGEWSRLRSSRQGKRAEEGNDELVNHALQKNQAPTIVSATSLSLLKRA